MIGKKLRDAMNEQVKNELESYYIYLSMAAYFHSTNLDGMAHWMRCQAHEEMVHAMKFFDHILERGGKVTLTLEGDGDIMRVAGVGDFDDLTITFDAACDYWLDAALLHATAAVTAALASVVVGNIKDYFESGLVQGAHQVFELAYLLTRAAPGAPTHQEQRIAEITGLWHLALLGKWPEITETNPPAFQVVFHEPQVLTCCVLEYGHDVHRIRLG